MPTVTHDNVVLFYGRDSVFSNMFISPFKDDDGVTFNCVEQYFHHTKMHLAGYPQIAKEIKRVQNPFTQKRLGNTKLQAFDNEAWDHNRFGAMFFGNLYKFSQNPDLKRQLIDTGHRRLAEASPTDLYWGIGIQATDPRASNPANWRGENKLGLVLTNIRYWLTQDITDIHLTQHGI